MPPIPVARHTELDPSIPEHLSFTGVTEYRILQLIEKMGGLWLVGW